MAVDGAVKEKKKKKIKENELAVTAEDAGTKNMTKYQHASVQTTIKTEQSEVNICEVDQHEYKNAEKKKKKKKIQEEKLEENDVVALCCDASVQTAVKTELLEMNISEGGLEKSDDLPRKEKKKKKKKDKAEKVDGECLQESRIKKVKKKKDKQIDSVIESGEIKKKKKKHMELKEKVDVGHSEKINKKKKKKKKRSQDEEQNPESKDGEVKRKRKKADKHIKTEESDECTEEPTKKKKKKEKNASLKTENYKDCVNGDKEKVKNKKEKLSPVKEEMNDINTEKKSKKKKKKKRLENLDEGQHEGPAPVNRTKAKTGDVIEKISSKHQKKIKMEVDDVMEEEPQENKIKQHKNKSTEKREVVFLSAKPGNQDEVSIDQARRLALQKDIDKESQPKASLGQWGTAQFDSSDRQAKFMRLMGGFKKSSQPITERSGQANMALGKEGQQTLQQGLLGEFEHAQSRHLDFRNKGIGLGFTAPSNKKFAIDVHARNSIRFDD